MEYSEPPCCLTQTTFTKPQIGFSKAAAFGYEKLP